MKWLALRYAKRCAMASKLCREAEVAAAAVLSSYKVGWFLPVNQSIHDLKLLERE